MKSKLERQGYAGSLSRKRSKTDDSNDKPRGRALLYLSFLLIWLTSIFSFYVLDHALHFVPFIKGQVATRDVFARCDFSFTCENEQTKLESDANNVTPAFSIDSQKVSQDLLRVGIFLKLLEGESVKGDYSDVRTLVESLGVENREALALFFKDIHVQAFFKKNLYRYLTMGVADDNSIFDSYSATSFSTVDYNNRVSNYSTTDLLTKERVALRVINDLNHVSAGVNKVITPLSRVIQDLIRANLTYNEQLTLATAKAPIVRQNNTYVSFKVGDRIIKKGEKVTRMQLLSWCWYKEALHKDNANLHGAGLLGFSAFSFFIILLFLGYLVKNKLEVAKSKKLLFFFSFVVSLNFLLMIGIYKVFSRFVYKNYVDLNNENFILIFLPCMFAAMIMALLVDRRSGTMAGLLVSLISGIIFGFSILHFSVLLVITFVSAFSVAKAKNRASIMKGSFYSVLSGLLVLSPVLIVNGLPLIGFAYLLGFALAGFLIIFLLIMLLLPVLEFISGQTSNLSLLELCDLGHPLLVRMQVEAPGSYHHSLMVATIAEHAAKSIGANPLLARVCSYFHDIGKMVKSDYFTENNENSKEKHLDISAKMSTIVIQNHVKEGVNLAYKYKLKKPLIEAIEQHHGKSLVSFFYQVAKGQTGDKYKVEDSDFRYRGPNPSRKEIVIIAIADPCEAASRSLVKANYNSILAMVSSIINSRFQDGMFAEAEITLKEMETIKLSIVHTLCSIKHTRISYPSEQNGATTLMEDSTKANDDSAEKDAKHEESTELREGSAEKDTKRQESDANSTDQLNKESN